jgi:GMP synthase (glutamine-hydrolysing)
MAHILLVENRSRHTRAFAHRLTAYGTVARVPYWRLTPGHIAAADIIVLSGGWPSVIHHQLFFRHELELIRTSTKPILGICLGFELIVKAFGGQLHRLPRKIHGPRIVTLDVPILSRPAGPIRVWESHRWAAPNPPDGLIQLAHSHTGVEFVRHSNRPIIGCQFHPEIDVPANDGGAVLEAAMVELLLVHRPKR